MLYSFSSNKGGVSLEGSTKLFHGDPLVEHIHNCKMKCIHK